ncbi:MAG: fibronectin type III domain-containing protein, partial [Thermoplasmata archaeon]
MRYKVTIYQKKGRLIDMFGKRKLGLFVVLLFVIGSMIPAFTFVTAPGMLKIINGSVNENVTTGVRAYDPDPAKNGYVDFYIQNRTNNGTDGDFMQYNPNPLLGDFYNFEISDVIPGWLEGDPGITIVNQENGTYLDGKRAGYVAYSKNILDELGSQNFPNMTLRKIPVLKFINNGSNFIEFSWDPLYDPDVLIAGYTVYRSPTNESGTWSLVSGNKDNPVIGTEFNDTSVSPNSSYYYALKVCFVGYTFNNPLNIDNYECMYLGEGSMMMISNISDKTVDYIVIRDAPSDLGAEVDSITINIGETTITVYACGYNGTEPLGEFVGVVEVNWTPDLDTLGYCLPDKDTLTAFYAYYEGGSVDITGENETLNVKDNFTVIIRTPVVDYIKLLDTPDGDLANEIQDQIWNVGDPLMIYAAGYNYTGPTPAEDTFVG